MTTSDFLTQNTHEIMNIVTYRLSLIGILCLCFTVQAQQQNTAESNLHKTVTHRENSSASVNGLKEKPHTELNPSQENRMPQKLDFGRYSGLVTIFKHYITQELPDVERRGMASGIYLPNGYDYKKWTKEDLTNLAGSFNGLEMFETLVLLKDVAGNQPTEKLTAKDIQCAQNALNELKPDNISWKKFGNWIIEVEQATEAKRAELKQKKQQTQRNFNHTPDKSGALFEHNIVPSLMDDKGFDQQAALALLEKNAVKMDSEHSLKSPDPKAVALDAVKAIKGAVRAA